MLSDFSPLDVSPAREVDYADLFLRNRRDRLLDIFLRKKSLCTDGLFEEGAGMGPYGATELAEGEDGGIATRQDWPALKCPIEFPSTL